MKAITLHPEIPGTAFTALISDRSAVVLRNHPHQIFVTRFGTGLRKSVQLKYAGPQFMRGRKTPPVRTTTQILSGDKLLRRSYY